MNEGGWVSLQGIVGEVCQMLADTSKARSRKARQLYLEWETTVFQKLQGRLHAALDATTPKACAYPQPLLPEKSKPSRTFCHFPWSIPFPRLSHQADFDSSNHRRHVVKVIRAPLGKNLRAEVVGATQETLRLGRLFRSACTSNTWTS